VKNKMSKIKEILGKFKNKKILVIGDVMLDRYIIGDISRISPEAPVPVVKVNKERHVPGGAANTANNIAELGGITYIAGIVGDDIARKILIDILKKKNIITDGLIIDENNPTIQKVRVVGQPQQVVRIDYEKIDSYNKETEKKLINYLKKTISKVDVVVMSDYEKGAITKTLASTAITLCKENKKPLIVDPKPKNIQFYKDATLITPNQKEASEITEIENKLENVVLMGEQLKKMLNSNILITKGEYGSSLIDLKGDIIHIPTKAKEVYDVSGAGDTVVATLALALATGADLKYAAVLANHAAGIVVGKTGTATTNTKEIVSLFEKEESKIKTLDELKEIIKDLKRKGKKIVWTNGCFDILHVGHIKYLQKAKELGDILILGVNADDSPYLESKGPGRPILKQDERAELLSAIGCIDYIVFFSEETPIKQITALEPDIVVKGGDYDGNVNDNDEKGVVGHDLMKKTGGKTVIIPLVGEFSTTNIIKKILESHKK